MPDNELAIRDVPETGPTPRTAGEKGRSRIIAGAGRLTWVLPIFALLAVWEVVARSGTVPKALLPTATNTIGEFATMVWSGELLTAGLLTLREAVIGLVISCAIGIPIGIMMAVSRVWAWFWKPFVSFGFSTPTITLLPIFVLWFGTGSLSKELLVALSCFFPMALSTFNGAREIPRVLVWSGSAMGLRRTAILFRVILPGCATFIFSGIRIALPLGVIIAVLAEMIAGGGGLGYVMVFAYQFLDTSREFAALLAILILGVVLDAFLLWLRRKALRWE